MRFKTLLLVGFLAILTPFIVSGCTSTSEKAAEKIIEKSTNGSAKVDYSTNSVKVNVNGASWEAGDQVSLPSGFPSDVYVVDGTIKLAYANNENKGYTVSIETPKAVSEVKNLYETKLQADGWTIVSTSTIQGSIYLSADKDNRTVTVGSSESDGKVTVTITVFEKS